MEWEPIERGRPEVDGVDPDYEGLLRVRIDLSRRPSREWAEFFLNPVGVGISLSMHPPELSGSSISIRPPDTELETYVAHVDERIEAANERYEQEVLPTLRRAAETRAGEEEERTRRLEDAKKRAEDL